MKVDIITFNSNKISIDKESGYCNATQFLKDMNNRFGFNRRLQTFFSQNSTILFIMSLNTIYYKKEEIYRSNSGRGGVTWMHPCLFAKFIFWISPILEAEYLSYIEKNNKLFL